VLEDLHRSRLPSLQPSGRGLHDRGHHPRSSIILLTRNSCSHPR